MNGKWLYMCCVKTLNRGKLNGRDDTMWRRYFDENDESKPGWRALYKLPAKKQSGDLQWRILHGAVAVNALVSKFNSTVSNVCPFCGKIETIAHCFLECDRIDALFGTLESLFSLFEERWSKIVFIYGAGYRRNNASKWQLLNFLLGEAKLAIYLTRRNRVEREVVQDLVSVFISLVRARVWIDFKFHKLMKNMDIFVEQWCYNDVICSVVDETLCFGLVFV